MLDFIRREKIYTLMLLFIVAINIASFGRERKPQASEKKPLSSLTFEEAGITEGKVRDFFESGKLSAKFFRYAMSLAFFVFIASLISNINFIFKGKRIDFRTFRNKRAVSWGMPDLIRATILIISLGYLVGMMQGFIFKIFGVNIGMNLRMIINTFFIDIMVLGVVFYFVAVKYREGLASLGLGFSSFFKNILSGIKGYIFILPLLIAVLAVSIYILKILGYSPPPQPVFEIFMEEERSRILFLLTAFVSVLGPIIEEVFFRGFMYSAIKKRFGMLVSMFLSASIFSFLHTNIAGFLPIMTLGVLLAYLYEKTGSLIASITVHIIHNSIILGFVFFIKELM